MVKSFEVLCFWLCSMRFHNSDGNDVVVAKTWQ